MKIQPIKPLPSIKIVGFPLIKPLPSIKDCFNNNKNQTIMEKERRITAPEGCEIEKVEIVDGAAVVTFRGKERKLPKSWEEFCRIYPIKNGEYFISTTSGIECVGETERFRIGESRDKDYDENKLPDRATAEAVLALCQLIQLRNAYNGDWVPDWKDNTDKYFIEFCNNGIQQNEFDHRQSSPLYFETKELCNEFLRNFRQLIEKLKPLYGIKEGGEE